MAINLYEFFDLTMETYSDYVSRYDIELNTFLREFEDNTEALFIDYQKVYLKKMSQDIIVSINKINSNDPEGEFVFNHLQKKLATNRRILEFLDQRLNAPNKAIALEPKANTSKDEVSDFLDKLNNGKVIKSYMIDFLESRNTRQKLEALIEDIENYKVDYITNALVYNETNTKPFLEESFTIFKELVLSKMEDLKNNDASDKVKSEKPFKTMKEAILYHIFEHNGSSLKRTINTNDAKELAEKYGFKSPTSGQQFREDYNVLVFEHNRIDKDLYPNKKSLTTIIDYYENVIKELPNQNKEKVKEELKILENFRDQFHKYN